MRTLWQQQPQPWRTGPSSSTGHLEDRELHRRAVEAVIWGMPAVNYDRMLQAMIHIGGTPNQVVYWSRPVGWKNQTLTPNPDTIYVMPFIDTRDAGPVVLEIPPADTGTIVGSVDDCWQMAIEDVGPAGVDKGKGGKYVILPPGHTGHLPQNHIALRSPTYQSFAILRSNYASAADADIANAVAFGKRVKVYPLSQVADPPPTRFVDAIDEMFDATIPYDPRFFQSLHRMVEREPWLTRDKAMIDTLKSIGIEKGKPFTPGDRMLRVFGAAALEARAWLGHRLRTSYFPPPYYDGGHWHVPASDEVIRTMAGGADPDSYPVDNRAVAYSIAYFSAKHLGTGQFYLMAIKDRRGERLDGRASYRLHVPPAAPVRQYWSATAYDGSTHTLIRETPWSSRASTSPGLVTNADGSVDIYFGPAAPNGGQANWVPTKSGATFEVIFRFYGPGQALFDKSWKLPDLERSRETA